MKVEKMNLLKKVTAALSAVVMAAGAVSAIPTCAIGLHDHPESAFEYELETFYMSTDKVGVRLSITNNPGVSYFSFALMYDDNCTWDGLECESSNLPIRFFCGENEGKHIIVGSFLNTQMTPTQSDAFGTSSYFMEFNVAKGASYPLHFSSAIFDYKSTTENISFGYTINSDKPYYIPDSEIGVGIKNSAYRIGDVNGDNKITLDDGFDILQIARYGNNNLTVDALNEYLIKHSICRGTRTWNDMFPKLTYAECADANQDGSIKPEDSDEVLEYVSEAAASNITMSTLVNSMGYKKVTYEY